MGKDPDEEEAGVSLPMHGVEPTRLPEPPAAAATALEVAVRDGDAAALRTVAAAHPRFLDAWARLAEHALAAGDPVAAFAFARTGYHRGLDAIRGAGWRGSGPVPWSHEPNRGFLRAVAALLRASEAIGEAEEVERLTAFLAELDPEDGLNLRG